MNQTLVKLKNVFGGKKAGTIIFAVGLLGILLIFFSSLLPKSGADAPQSATEQTVDQTYCEKLEAKIEDLVKAITGSEQVSVVVTLESGSEFVYANEKKQDTDVTQELTGQDSTKTRQSGSEEQNYIIVKKEDGSEYALLVTELMPKIRGVAIVCAGGADEQTSAAVVEAVTTLLNISAKKVSVNARAPS